MARLPTLFLSHGSPLHALDPGGAGQAWQTLAAGLPRPRAVLMVSAHWETGLPMLTGGDRHRTIHDFSGFPAPLYELRYDAPGDPALAQRIAGTLREAGYSASINACRGLDHGAWVPLRWMFGHADVPVIQLSVQPSLGVEHHLRVGEGLWRLADDEVLVIGSGHATHNLRDWATQPREAAPLPYAREFAEWLHARLLAGDREALLDYRALAPCAMRAHPTEEHLLPLFTALGAAGHDARAERVHAGFEGGALAMDAYRFTSPS
jgi:4,5-DOPA dioxygenase extradiol